MSKRTTKEDYKLILDIFKSENEDIKQGWEYEFMSKSHTEKIQMLREFHFWENLSEDSMNNLIIEIYSLIKKSS